MRMPNGYGTVKKLSGVRRKPYMVCEGQSGKQKIIGYVATREEGLAMLAKYNRNPWNIDAKKITLQQLFELWQQKRGSKLGIHNYKSLNAAYSHCRTLADVPYQDIKAYDMQDCIDNCGYGYSTQAAIKNLWNHLDRFAQELEITNKQYSSLLTSDPAVTSHREPFTEEEIALLWANRNQPGVEVILFLIYTGYRVSELMALTKDKIDLTNGVMYGGVKTSAGKNRIVPIHSKIKDIVCKWYEAAQSEFLLSDEGEPMYYAKFMRYIWNPVMRMLQFKHTPHETRHTFRSRLDSAGANQVCIDRMMGHVSDGTGRRVYTHKDIEELRTNIELVTV